MQPRFHEEIPARLVHPSLAPYSDRVCTAEQALQSVRPGDRIFIGTACATPRATVAALEALSPLPAGIELLHVLTDQALPHDTRGRSTTRLRHRCFFVGSDVSAAVQQGLADYVPLSLARVPELMAIGRIPVDVAVVQVSLPDEAGNVSLGVSVDVALAALKKARVVIAEVNPAMPRTLGLSSWPVSRIQHLVLVPAEVVEYRHPPVSDPAMVQIARYIGSLIDDGSTLQIGMGRFANEALKHLSDRRDLGIHSDVITDAILPLLDKGILTGQRKTDQVGRIVTSYAMGTRALYDRIDGNPDFSFQPIDAVCDPSVLARQHKLVSVTQAFAIDLTGQVCADQNKGVFYGGIAAQAEFLQAASRSPGGKAIICLAATEDDGQVSRIRPQLLGGEGVAIARADVHYVVTEFGVAYLFGKSIRERAIALIQIAHPNSRSGLLEAAHQLGLVPADQRLRNLRAYAVHDERTITVPDRPPVLLRPVTAADAGDLRELFHRLPQRDVYTRFFRKLQGLSNSDVQRLVNLDDENEVALVGVTGPREQPLVVAHGMYVIDPSTNLAETAFMVHPDWQGLGLGSALQRRLAEHAQSRGVRGFVADILTTNERMIRLAAGGAGQVRRDSLGGSVQITTLF